MKMISSDEVNKIATTVASANLSTEVVKRVLSEPMVDSEGHDALRLTIVIANNSVDGISGDAALDTLVQIQQGLEKAGDDRFAVVQYATEEELENGGDQP